MMTNNNIFRIKRESDIFEIVEDNRDKLVVVVFNYEIKNKEELIKMCDDDLIILLVEIDNYETDGLITINKIPEYVLFNDKDTDKVSVIKESLDKIIYYFDGGSKK